MMRPSSRGKNLTVLVVDPDPRVREQIALCLAPRFRVVSAASGGEAMSQIAAHSPAIILIELDQPDGDGLHLIQAIRGLPFGKRAVIACLTNRSGVRDKVAGFQAGADDYVVKPVNQTTFLYRVVLLARSIATMW